MSSINSILIEDRDTSSSASSFFKRGESDYSSDMDLASCAICSALVCGSVVVSDALHHTPGVFRLVRCRNCGHLQLACMLDREQLQTAYTDHYVVRGMAPDDNSLRARVLRHFISGVEVNRVQLIRQHMDIHPGTRLLDVGCGNGTFLDAVTRLTSCEVVGLEPDSSFVRKCCARGLDVRQTTLPDFTQSPDLFDVVTMWHCLEHTGQPLSEMELSCQCLKPGGRLFIGVPDISGLTARVFGRYWFGLDVPRHTHQFRPSDLVQLTERAGMHALDVQHITEISTVAGSMHNYLGLRWCDDLKEHLFKWVAIQALFMPVDLLLQKFGFGDWMVFVAKRPRERS